MVHNFDLGKYYGEDDDGSAASGAGIISSSTASSGIIGLPTMGDIRRLEALGQIHKEFKGSGNGLHLMVMLVCVCKAN